MRKGAIRCPRDRHVLDGRDRVIILKKRHRRNEKRHIFINRGKDKPAPLTHFGCVSKRDGVIILTKKKHYTMTDT